MPEELPPGVELFDNSVGEEQQAMTRREIHVLFTEFTFWNQADDRPLAFERLDLVPAGDQQLLRMTGQ